MFGEFLFGGGLKYESLLHMYKQVELNLAASSKSTKSSSESTKSLNSMLEIILCGSILSVGY